MRMLVMMMVMIRTRITFLNDGTLKSFNCSCSLFEICCNIKIHTFPTNNNNRDDCDYSHHQHNRCNNSDDLKQGRQGIVFLSLLVIHCMKKAKEKHSEKFIDLYITDHRHNVPHCTLSRVLGLALVYFGGNFPPVVVLSTFNLSLYCSLTQSCVETVYWNSKTFVFLMPGYVTDWHLVFDNRCKSLLVKGQQ